MIPKDTIAQSPCSNGVVVPSPQSNSSRNLVTECNTLLALKDTLRGQAPLDWSPSKPISLWEGISLSDSRYAVTRIDLSRKGLDGTLAPGLGRLSRLEHLVLHENALRGHIPPQLADLDRLSALVLSSNQLIGNIPNQLGGLPNLQQLYLADNSLTGGIPKTLASLTHLKDMNLSNNNLTGPIPSQFQRLAKLVNFHVQGNSGLSGPLQLGSHRTTVTIDFDEHSTLPIASIRPPTPDSPFQFVISGPDSDLFSVDALGTLTFQRAPDHERPTDSNQSNTYLFSVSSENDDPAVTHSFQILVRELNEPPLVIPHWNRAFQENSQSPIGNLRAIDPEGEPITWSLAGEDHSQLILRVFGNNVQVAFRTAPDHEHPTDQTRDNRYSFTVVTSDGTNRTETLLNVTVTNIPDEPPVIEGATEVEYIENRRVPVQSYTANDPDNAGKATWSLSGPDSELFRITAEGQLRFTIIPNYETPLDEDADNNYDVTIVATGPGGRSFIKVTVTVTDSEEIEHRQDLEVNMAVPYAENADTAVTTLSLADQNIESKDAEWEMSGQEQEAFRIEAHQGEATLYFIESPDFETPTDTRKENDYSVNVRAVDNKLNRVNWVLHVRVSDENEPPIITPVGRLQYPESGTSTIHLFSAVDPEEQPLTWTVTGPDGEDFAIDEQGALTFIRPPDFELPKDSNHDNLYLANVIASDMVNSTSLPVEVAITNVNDRPDFHATIAYPEDRTGPVLTLTATDQEGESVSWSISGPDSQHFAIDELGVLTFTTQPNYERPTDTGQDNVYVLVIEAASSGLDGRLPLKVMVLNANDPPVAETIELTTDHKPRIPIDISNGYMKDEDPGHTPTLIGVTQPDPETGTVETTSKSSLVFIPAANHQGPLKFPYHITDGTLIATGWVFLEVHPRPPTETANSATPQDNSPRASLAPPEAVNIQPTEKAGTAHRIGRILTYSLIGLGILLPITVGRMAVVRIKQPNNESAMKLSTLLFLANFGGLLIAGLFKIASNIIA